MAIFPISKFQELIEDIEDLAAVDEGLNVMLPGGKKKIKKMRQDEVVKKNISLVFDFLRYLTDYPELIKKLMNS